MDTPKAPYTEGLADCLAATLNSDEPIDISNRNLAVNKVYPDDYAVANTNHENELIPGGAAWDSRQAFGNEVGQHYH